MSCPPVAGGTNIVFNYQTAACHVPGYYRVTIKFLSTNCANVDDPTFPTPGYYFYLDITKATVNNPTITASFAYTTTPYTYTATVDTIKIIPFPVITISPVCTLAMFTVEPVYLPACISWTEAGGLVLDNCGLTT